MTHVKTKKKKEEKLATLTNYKKGKYYFKDKDTVIIIIIVKFNKSKGCKAKKRRHRVGPLTTPRMAHTGSLPKNMNKV